MGILGGSVRGGGQTKGKNTVGMVPFRGPGSQKGDGTTVLPKKKTVWKITPEIFLAAYRIFLLLP